MHALLCPQEKIVLNLDEAASAETQQAFDECTDCPSRVRVFAGGLLVFSLRISSSPKAMA